MQELSLDEVNEITLAYGKFVEVANGPLMELFHSEIPESLLPFPKNVIERALIYAEKFWVEEGNMDAAESLASTRVLLMAYKDSTESLQGFQHRLGDAAWRKAILPRLGHAQKQQLASSIGREDADD